MTIGQNLDSILDLIEATTNTLGEQIDELTNRITYLEAKQNSQTNTGPVVEPTLPPPPTLEYPFAVTPPAKPQDTTERSTIESNSRVRLDGQRGWVSIENKQDVIIDIPEGSYTEQLYLANSQRVWIRGPGRVGKIVSFPEAPFSDLTVDDIEYVGAGGGTANELRGTRIALTNCRGRVDTYGIWADHCSHVGVYGCNFETYETGTGYIESCVRFVDCGHVIVADSVLKADRKHCFRVHGNSANVGLVGCTLAGGNGIKCGTSGDFVRGLYILQNTVTATGLSGFEIGNDGLSIQNVRVRLNKFFMPFDSLTAYKGQNLPGVVFEENEVNGTKV